MFVALVQASVAPHRSYFAAGGVAVLAASLGWTAALLLPGPGAVPAQAVHGTGFMLLLFGPFVFGFLSTVFARWQDAPNLPRAVYVPAALLFAFAAAALPWGALASRTLLAVAFGAGLLAWTLAGGGLAWMLWRAAERVVHAKVALAGVTAGWVALALATAWAVGVATTPQAAETVALWGFLLPVYFAVGHRMVPFFSSVVVPGYTIFRPAWAPGAWVALCAARLAVSSAAAPTLAPLLAPLLDAALAAIAIRHTVGWQLWQARRGRLLFALHLGFAWIGAGLALSALDGALLLATGAGLGRAPLHALAIGGFASLLVAMVTRVSLGHSGRPLEMDHWAWGSFVALQAAALVRIVADLVGPAWDARTALLRVAALVWAAAFVVWTTRFAPIWFRPRIDGKPG